MSCSCFLVEGVKYGIKTTVISIPYGIVQLVYAYCTHLLIHHVHHDAVLRTYTYGTVVNRRRIDSVRITINCRSKETTDLASQFGAGLTAPW